MRTIDFIKKHRMSTMCPNFDGKGCNAYDGEECDAVFFLHEEWHGKKMVDRIIDHFEKAKK